MKQIFIKKAQNPHLLLFFAGWGADEQLLDYPVCEGYDYLLCFDYRSMDFDYSLLEGYRSIRLLAWSMGVWAASCVFAGKSYPWEMRLAVNGTPCPIDDVYGIPEAIFSGTLKNFSEQTLVRFRRRMCGSAEEVKRFLAHAPYRSLEELRDELAVLDRNVRAQETPSFVWDKVVVGQQDKIFPASNQLHYWIGKAKVVEAAMEHYADTFFAACIAGKEELWIKN